MRIPEKRTFIVIQDWMLALGLDIYETVILAIIYGFSQDGETTFRGSWKYLEYHAKCSRRKVASSLADLVEKGLVKKKDIYQGGVKFCEYAACTGGAWDAPVVHDVHNVVQEMHGGGAPDAPNNIEYNGENKFSPNKENNAQSAQPRPFDFKKALLEMGVSEQHASDWMAVRKAKRMTNTRTAFDRLKAHIERACKQYTVTPDDCVAFAASKDWGGFDSSWEAIKEITKNNTLNEDDRVRRAYAAAEAKFKGDLHF